MDLQQRQEAEQLYTAAVGPRADSYVPKFIGFDTYNGGRTSWNWTAFFFTLPWMLYRRMFGYAAVYFLLFPTVAWVLSRFIGGALPPQLAPFLVLAFLACVFFVAPAVYADAMYHTTIARRIHAVQDVAPDFDKQVEILGLQRNTSLVAGILGAILAMTTSAWSWDRQDRRTAQEHVQNAIMHTGYVQADLEQFYEDNEGRWPRDGQEMNLDDSARSRFVERMEVRDGNIRLTFGDKATRQLRGKLLVLEPVISEPFRLDWICVDGPAGEEKRVSPKYWSRNCDSRSVQL